MEFPQGATDLIHARSRGVPRIINVICDAALVFGYAEERRVFDEATIADVLEELETTGVLPPKAGTPRPGAPAGERPHDAAHAVATTGPVAMDTPAPALATAAGSDAREKALDRRERLVSQRELELAEQRRVLSEEYRLLRARQAAAAPEPGRRGAASDIGQPPMSAPSGGRVRLHASRSGASRFDAVHVESFWSRLKRIMLGVSAS
jgi:hypothetical protein